MPSRDPFDDLEPDAPEPTARPFEREARARVEGDDEKLVPMTNVGGASPTPLGLDSGGDLPGSADDLASLSEPEPPEPPEVGAVHVRDDEEGGAPKPRG
ncbi:MAG TPA: hypothetical protein VFL83_07560 [Anaeromyxobacter sp.]|nr:hypothetical protein [Anaeromyxobacter sp.]